MRDSFKTRTTLAVGNKSYEIHSLPALQGHDLARLPFSLKILLENLLRFEDGVNVTQQDIEALLKWDAKAAPSHEIAFTPARVIMQDFTGVPAIVDLAAMREAMIRLGGNPQEINPLAPAELVIDHSVQVDNYGTADSLARNNATEFGRNVERYSFLRWGQTAFSNFKVVPPNTGIVHQVNVEHLARVVFAEEKNGVLRAFPDTLVGTDSHTTMVNGLGVLGWGVGGIEAEAAMLGQPVTMLIPQVIGFRLKGALPAGTTATDLVLTITEMLRKKGVVDKFVEFFGDGLAALPLADRATIANMAPEFGSTCGIFPIDEETIRYLELTGRSAEQIALVEAYARAQGMWRTNGMREADYTDVLELDLATIEPSLAGPKRPQDRVPLRTSKAIYRGALARMVEERTLKNPKATGKAVVTSGGKTFDLTDGAVMIAAITSCTNTSNPAVLIGAGLLARKARSRGLVAKPWVKTSLAPGSRVVTDYLTKAGLLPDLESVGFYVVGYGCTTCIGNSGPLKPEISEGIKAGDIVTTSVLSGNRNFEGRVHPEVKMNFLASPPLVVAYALAGTMDIDLNNEPIGTGTDGKPVFLQGHLANGAGDPAIDDGEHQLRDVQERLCERLRRRRELECAQGARGRDLPVGAGLDLRAQSAVLRRHDHDAGRGCRHSRCARAGTARRLGHDRPHLAGRQHRQDQRGSQYLMAQGVQPVDFNQYGARRGNHEVMMRGTFANIRLRNLLCPGTEGGVSLHVPTGEQSSIYDIGHEVQGGRHAAGRDRGQGVRHGLVTRLGGQGHDAARREGGDRRELRAYSSLQPDRHGCAAPAVQGRRERAVTRAHRQGKPRDHRPERRSREGRDRRGDSGRRQADQVRSTRAHRHAEGARLLPARRHPAVRDSATGVAGQSGVSRG